MLDQYGKEVPEDLVVLDMEVKDLTKEELHAIDHLDWYEPIDYPSLILVSATDLTKVLGFSDFTDPFDVECDVNAGVRLIDHSLHRYNDADNFSHA